MRRNIGSPTTTDREEEHEYVINKFMVLCRTSDCKYLWLVENAQCGKEMRGSRLVAKEIEGN